MADRQRKITGRLEMKDAELFSGSCRTFRKGRSMNKYDKKEAINIGGQV
jgi:hypothetical protein